MSYRTENTRVSDIKELSTPDEIRQEFPISEKAAKTVYDARGVIHDVLAGKDDRLVVVTGPCSIHDTKAGLEFAERMQPLIKSLADDLFIVMRVYFEKPRTTVGWKGLINDPNLDDSYEINKGLRLARQFLLDIGNMGIPTGTEYLDLITPQYISDLVSWGAIGARTTESQGHRELSSGLSCPVGFKNGTSGNMQIAVDAIRAAGKPHRFIGVNEAGQSAIVTTKGNEDCHIILRGGKQPNYDAASIDDASALLEKAKLPLRVMVDVSHANSRKICERQMDVGFDLAQQITRGEDRIFGVMVESHLVAGRQDIVNGKAETYGQSITDACLGWEDHEVLLGRLAEAVRARREKNK